MNISVTTEPRAEDAAVIDKNLDTFNETAFGPAERMPLSVLVHDENGTLVAGINGMTSWGWLYVQRLWVSESERGKGVAGKMLAAAEEEARKRGCRGAYIDAVNPVALKSYKRQGYTEFGVIKQFAAGLDRTFLQKTL
ncbi:UNVERIFIED_ORG: acetyltransferase (GNAT) family protein [Martelella mediterranea]